MKHAQINNIKRTILFAGFLTASQMAFTQAVNSDFVSFEKTTVDDTMQGGYGIEVADMDGDGLTDIIALATSPAQFAWYKNPSWGKFTISTVASGNIDSAPKDIDGDGDMDIVLASAFSLGASTEGGLIHWLENPGDPTLNQEWVMHYIDEIPTSHRIKWGDINGDGKQELVNLPIIGVGATAPLYDVSMQLKAYEIPEDLGVDSWTGVVLDQSLHMAHGLSLLDWNADGKKDLLTASFEGVTLFQMGVRGKMVGSIHLGAGHEGDRPAQGSSEVDAGKFATGDRFIASIEPWHGNEVVVYTPGNDPAALWQREVIETGFVNGHALLVEDLDNDGQDEIVAGHRSEPFNLFIYRFNNQDSKWHRIDLDVGGIGLSGLAIADLDGDGFKDIVGIGSATSNVVYYRNSGTGN